MKDLILLVDVGNTNVVFAISDGDRIIQQYRIATLTSRTADDYMVWLSSLMAIQGYSYKHIKACVISTVVPAGLFNLRTLCNRYFNIQPLIIGDAKTHIRLQLDSGKPLQQLGADRIATTLGAFSLYPEEDWLMVIDSGTAITFDLIRRSTRTFVGGAIAPGIMISIEALSQKAAKLPSFELKKPVNPVSDTTIGNLESGSYWGYVGLMNGMITQFKKAYPLAAIKVVATGGAANFYKDEKTLAVDFFEQDLILHGLLEVYRHNQ